MQGVYDLSAFGDRGRTLVLEEADEPAQRTLAARERLVQECVEVQGATATGAASSSSRPTMASMMSSSS